MKSSYNGESIKQEIIECEFTGYKGHRWVLDEDCVLNPNIDVDTIKNRIAVGRDPYYVHPYYHSFNVGIIQKAVVEIKPPEIEVIRRKNIMNGKKFIKIGKDMIIFLNKVSRVQKKRFFVAIDPTKPEVEINKSIAEFRKAKLEEIKKDRENNKETDYANCYVPHINRYVESLRKYDEIYLGLSSQIGEENIVYQNGIFQIPEDKDVVDLIPNEAYERREKESGMKEDAEFVYNTFIKTFPAAYEKAVEMISKAPRIKFYGKVK